jgi:hypothetical protein
MLLSSAFFVGPSPAGPKQSGLLSLAQHLHLVLLTIGYHIAAADSVRY